MHGLRLPLERTRLIQFLPHKVVTLSEDQLRDFDFLPDVLTPHSIRYPLPR